jgi:hypothetical protein
VGFRAGIMRFFKGLLAARQTTSCRSALILPAVVLFCLIWTSGCVPTIFNRKSTAAAEKAGQPAASLMRPRLADGKDQAASPSPEAKEFDDPKKRAADEGKSPETPRSVPTVSATKREPVSPTEQSKMDKASKTTAEKEAPKSSPTAVESTKNDKAWATPSGKAEPGTNKDPEGKAPGATEPVKKHDHTKYVAMVKDKAREILAEHPGATYVRLCQDSTTDIWTLSIYQKGDKTYSAVSYSWDEVDQKWNQTYESSREPISRWKGHLAYSAARKACTDLKGSPE